MTVEHLLTVLACALILWGSLAAHAEVPRLPLDFEECPRDVEGFLRHVVERRSAEALNRVRTEEADPLDLVLYRGAAEDANVAWIGAVAYKQPWSRFHHNEVLRERAFRLMDALTRIYPRGEWDEGGLNAYFGLHSFAWAALEWLETGDVDAEREARWKEHLRLAADHAMQCMHEGPYRPSPLTGQYANPEFYYLAGLAAAWRILGEERYRQEAADALRRYDEWLFPGGGMAYFIRSAPQHGYQHMIVKGTALYWDLTGDEYALEMLRRMAPYFPNVQHRSGLVTDAENPHLKHTFANHVNPGAAVLIACATGDGTNTWAAEIATPIQADNVQNRRPSFPLTAYAWYNYHAATWAAAALRLLERLPLPPAQPLPARRVFADESFQGVRSHWDDFTAAVGTRQMSDSLAGAYLAAPDEPLLPLQAAVDGVYFEVLQDLQPAQGDRPATYRRQHRTVEWDPTIYPLHTGGFAAVSCLTRLCLPYWGGMPFLPGERDMIGQVSNWTGLQHWAVWRDTLIGFGSLRCHADGGDPAQADQARIRWRLSPRERELALRRQDEDAWQFTYGDLQVELTRLEERGGFAFAGDSSGETPYAEWFPVLHRPAPWSAGDFVSVGTVIRPAGAEGQVLTRPLPQGAAALLVEPEGNRACLWVVNLARHQRQYLWDLPAGVSARAYKWRDRVMPPIPPGQPASTGLNGAESTVWEIESAQPLDAAALLASVRAGGGG